MKIINGRKIRDEILKGLKEEVNALSFVPLFCDILVGDDMSSIQYVNMKAKIAESVGIKFRRASFTESITTEELVEEIKNLNRVPYMCGIIIQLPLPSHIDKNIVLDAISPSLDVDCLGQINSEKFYNNDVDCLSYPTALACVYIIDSINLDFNEKSVVVLGQGKLVGLPVSHMLRSRGLSITTVNSKTENIKDIIKNADVIISALGQGKFITKDMVKKDVVIIDAGTSEDNGSVVGDVDSDSVSSVVSCLTPCPGGVGPVTVAMLLKNVLIVANNKIRNEP